MRIEWSEVAFEDLLNIQRYLTQNAPYYADHFIDKLMSATDKLEDFPEMGRLVPEADEDDGEMRELFYQRFRLMYQVNTEEDLVLIVCVVCYFPNSSRINQPFFP
jgi:toxin ParE1/3/4